jgi:hypothetical protein
VGSFWWINARRGRLKCFEPRSFAALIKADEAILRFPLVFHNTGAGPIVIQDIRLQLPREPEHINPFAWRASRSQIQPVNNEPGELPASFAIAGRVAEQTFIEFAGMFPSVSPEPRDYIVSVEAMLGHRRGWRELMSFVLHAGHIRVPDRNVAYSNDPGAVTNAEKEEAARALNLWAERNKSARPGR